MVTSMSDTVACNPLTIWAGVNGKLGSQQMVKARNTPVLNRAAVPRLGIYDVVVEEGALMFE